MTQWWRWKLGECSVSGFGIRFITVATVPAWGILTVIGLSLWALTDDDGKWRWRVVWRKIRGALRWFVRGSKY